MTKKISIIIPILNEEKFIRTCLDSVISSDYDKDHMEVFVIDGMSTDNTRNILKEYEKKYPFIKMINNKKRIIPAALNLGIENATGDFIIRLDAHSEYPINYFSTLINAHSKMKADNIGVGIITEVKNKNRVSNAIKKVLSSRFGVGNSEFRTGITETKEVETVPFGCYPKYVFEKYGNYDERLKRHEDLDFNKRIRRNGGKIFILSDIKCTYFARETYSELFKNSFRNGFWNILSPYYTKELGSLSLRHFIPFIFVLSLIIPILLSFINVNFLWIAIISFLSYFSLITIVSFKLGKEFNNFKEIFLTFFILHFTYGIASIFGIFSVIKRALFN